jgi:hypothetical protein
MDRRWFNAAWAFALVVVAGCSQERHPQALVTGMKQVSMLEGSVVRYLAQPVSRGMTVRFGVEETALTITGDGWLVWVDEQPDTQWPHAAMLVWVPADPVLAPRALRKGRLSDNGRVFLKDGRELPRRKWNYLAPGA